MCVGVCALVCRTDLSKTATTTHFFCQFIVLMNFHSPENVFLLCVLRPKDKQVIAILATLSK